MTHPRDMTMAQLEALPVVARLFRVDRGFVDARGRSWDVGQAAGEWSKARNEPDGVRLARPKAAQTAR